MKAGFRTLLFTLAPLILLAPMGAQAQELSTRIVGGSVVPDDRYPFMASVYIDFDGDGTALPGCGGSLIGSRWVLTAAHCLYDMQTQTVNDASMYFVLLDTRDVAAGDGLYLAARDVIVHPDYDPATNVADIALIELSQTVDTTRISLPSSTSAVPETGESAVVAGWGLTSQGGTPSNDLLEVSLPVVSHAQCLPYYLGSLRSESHFCAGGLPQGGTDSCQGDSGGPMFVVRDNFYVQAGVVSFGVGCAQPGVPGVYTRVTSYMDWLGTYVDDLNVISSDPGGNDSQNQTSGLQIPLLVSGNLQEGTLPQGDVQLYEVTGNSRVDLETRSGDADLYIFRGVQFRSEDLVCQSIEVTALDSCVIEATGDRMFATVFGYEDSIYVIGADRVRDDGVPDTGGSEDDAFFPGPGGGGGSGVFLLAGLLGLLARRSRIDRSTDH